MDPVINMLLWVSLLFVVIVGLLLVAYLLLKVANSAMGRDRASVTVFDHHNEYNFGLTPEGRSYARDLLQNRTPKEVTEIAPSNSSE